MYIFVYMENFRKIQSELVKNGYLWGGSLGELEIWSGRKTCFCSFTYYILLNYCLFWFLSYHFLNLKIGLKR